MAHPSVPPTPTGPARAPMDDFYRRVVEGSSDTTIVFDEVGTITYASPAVRHLVGVAPEQVVGTNITDYLEPEEVTLAVDGMAWAHQHATRHDIQTEIHFVVDGRRRAHDVRGRLTVHPDGSSESVVSLRDMFSVQVMGEILESVMRPDPIDRSLTLIAELGHDVLRGAGVAIACELGVGEAPVLVTKSVPARVLDDLPGAFATTTATATAATAADDDADGYAFCWSRPLVLSDGRDVGCLTVWNRGEDDMGPFERMVLDRLAQMTGFAIDRHVKDGALALAASRDPLTDLANRSHFVGSFGAVVESRPHPGDPRRTAVLLVDLDDFKPVNDRFGHLVGDQVLVVVADRLRRVIRSGDVAARLGGDEFAVLCPAVLPEDVVAIATRIIDAIGAPIPVGEASTVVGVSIGIAFGDGDDDRLEPLLGRADGALYAAKRAGKRRFVIAGATPA